MDIQTPQKPLNQGLVAGGGSINGNGQGIQAANLLVFQGFQQGHIAVEGQPQVIGNVVKALLVTLPQNAGGVFPV